MLDLRLTRFGPRFEQGLIYIHEVRSGLGFCQVKNWFNLA
jgi:hypothetical protein